MPIWQHVISIVLEWWKLIINQTINHQTIS